MRARLRVKTHCKLQLIEVFGTKIMSLVLESSLINFTLIAVTGESNRLREMRANKEEIITGDKKLKDAINLANVVKSSNWRENL